MPNFSASSALTGCRSYTFPTPLDRRASEGAGCPPPGMRPSLLRLATCGGERQRDMAAIANPTPRQKPFVNGYITSLLLSSIFKSNGRSLRRAACRHHPANSLIPRRRQSASAADQDHGFDAVVLSI